MFSTGSFPYPPTLGFNGCSNGVFLTCLDMSGHVPTSSESSIFSVPTVFNTEYIHFTRFFFIMLNEQVYHSTSDESVLFFGDITATDKSYRQLLASYSAAYLQVKIHQTCDKSCFSEASVTKTLILLNRPELNISFSCVSASVLWVNIVCTLILHNAYRFYANV